MGAAEWLLTFLSFPQAFDSGIAVTNYSKRERRKKDLDLLKQITRQRTIEQIDMKVSFPALSPSPTALEGP